LSSERECEGTQRKTRELVMNGREFSCRERQLFGQFRRHKLRPAVSSIAGAAAAVTTLESSLAGGCGCPAAAAMRAYGCRVRAGHSPKRHYEPQWLNSQRVYEKN